MFERNSRNANNASNSKNACDSQDASNNSETSNSSNATQATLNSVISKRKDKRFNIEAYYQNKTKRFDLVRLKSEQNQNVFDCSKLPRNQNRTFVFLKNDSKTKQKRFKMRQSFLKPNQNF